MTSIHIAYVKCALVGAAACLLSLIAASPVRAEEPSSPNEPVFGNTITIDIIGVYHAALYMNPDHTYREVSAQSVLKGTWAVEGDQVCLTQTSPEPDPGRRRICNPNTQHEVGDTWTNTDPVTGATVNIALVAGRN